MDDAALGAAVRALRHRRGWRQVDLAMEARVGPGVVGLLERGRADRLSVRAVRGICHALEIRLGWDAGFRGPELARLRDADHSAMVESLAAVLGRASWLTTAEASFNQYGDRGRIDLLAFHPAARTLLVVEVKTVIADVQGLLGRLDLGRRVATGVAVNLGWRPAAVVPLLVLAGTTTNRRRLVEHRHLFAGLAVRGRAARAWLRSPVGRPSGLLVFAKLPDRNRSDRRRAGRQRVRLRGR